MGSILSSGSPLEMSGVSLSPRFRCPAAKLCNLPDGLCVKLCFGTANACSGKGLQEPRRMPRMHHQLCSMPGSLLYL